MNRCNHLIQVTTDQCIGCTRCMRVCPTEAIRILDGKAHLSLDKCIYCGQCLHTCFVNAIKIQSNEKHELDKAHYHVAILPIAIYGMLKNQEDLSVIYQTLYDLGFDAVMDLSPIYNVLSEKIERYVVENEDNPLYEQLPKIDCCACGSPSCKALAEDVIAGKKRFEDCVVLSKNGKQTN